MEPRGYLLVAEVVILLVIYIFRRMQSRDIKKGGDFLNQQFKSSYQQIQKKI